MSIFNKFLLIFCFGIFVIGLNACPQQQPAEEGTVVEEEVVEEVEVPVATPEPEPTPEIEQPPPEEIL